jgi:PAS domain S-box-containing protein
MGLSNFERILITLNCLCLFLFLTSAIFRCWLMNNKQVGAGKQVVKDGISSHGFPIVGVGASAGGLEAFRALLEFLPVNTGLAFIIIQHLAAGQESLLTEILSRFTKMPVRQVEDNMHVEPNHVYVIPPGSTMTLIHGCLMLSPKGKSQRPIDVFLDSLALERKTQAIGVVLSGTGTDGTEGLKAIKFEGGITFAQDPESAQYAGMPQSSISAEAVDFVLPPDEIARELSKIAQNPQLVRAEINAQEPKIQKEPGLRKIFSLLKLNFNVDFTHYKESVVNRRITRRMVINHIDKVNEYAEYLGEHPSEIKALFGDMLLGVTSFFREPETFLILKEILFPEILKNHPSKEPIRIWIPGCSTGEEAYSFAIALQEFLAEKGTEMISIQIFGTDVNEKNVEKARQGIYPKSIEVDVSETRLKQFFSKSNGNYQIAKSIRDMCVFARQDLTADPPFSNLDLVSCRNMLIYFDTQLQEKIVPILHYALKLNGFLVLGESESIGKFTSLFEPVKKKSFIYAKKKAQPQLTFGFEAAVIHPGKEAIKEPSKKDAFVLLREEVDRLLITDYVPATLLINNNLDILVFRGNVTPFLSAESGQTSLNVSRIIRKELRSEVQTAVYRARKDDKPVKEDAISLNYGETQKTVNIQVIPLHTPQYIEPFFLVLIEDVSAAVTQLRQTIALSATPEGREDVKDNQIGELREELASSKQSLQTVIETQEVTNEELRSAMEELQSSNEELQSTNEELETAKEELQSSNEELTTLNDELKNRNQILGILSDNQANLAQNVDPAVVMVDKSLRIRLFTPSAQKILKLSPSDTGLQINKLRLAITVPDLEEITSNVMTKLHAISKEVNDEAGQFYEMRVRPFLAEGNRIDGAVLSFIDINLLKQHEKELQNEETKYRTLAENSPDVIARLDRNQRFLFVNSAIKEMSSISPKDLSEKTIMEAGLPKQFAKTWKNILQKVFMSGKTEKGEFAFIAAERKRVYQYVLVPEFSIGGTVETVLALLKDITDRKNLEKNLKESEERFILALKKTPVTVGNLDCALRFTWVHNLQSGYKQEDIIGKEFGVVMNFQNNASIIACLTDIIEKGTSAQLELKGNAPGGERVFDFYFEPKRNSNAEIIGISFTALNITERKKAEEALVRSRLSMSSIIDSTQDMIWSVNANNFGLIDFNESFKDYFKNEQKITVVAGMCPEDLFPTAPTFSEKWRGFYGRALKEGAFKTECEESAGTRRLQLSFNVMKLKGSLFAISVFGKDITEDKKAEDALKKQASLIDLSPDAIIVKKPDDTITFWNQGAQALYGWTSGEALGKKSHFLLKTAYSESIDSILKKLECNGRWSGEKVQRNKFGHAIIVASRYLANCDSSDKIIELFESDIDITERKRAEDKIRFEAERLNSVMENDQDLTLLTSTDGIILYVNSALKQITGYDKDEFLNKSPWIVHPEDSDRARENLNSVAAGKSTEFEHRILTKDGQTRWVIHSTSPILREGKVVEMVSSLKDITERKKAEIERETMVEFLRIANATNTPIELVKTAADFFQNQSGCEAVGVRLKEGDEYPYYVTRGFPPEHIRVEDNICARDDAGYVVRDSKGNPLIECMCGSVISGRFDPSKEFFTQKGSFWTNNTTLLLATTTSESRGKTRNCCNREGYESIALIPLVIGDNRLGLLQLNDKRKGMFSLETIQMWERIADRLASALSRTMSQEALRESELRYKDLANHLEALVDERTRQLKDSERLAAIGTVAAMVGHDIRNPLQAIAGDVYIAKTELTAIPDSPEKQNTVESLREIEKNNDYISKIVSDLQDLAKPLTPRIEEANIEKIFSAVLATIIIPESTAALYDIEKDFPKIKTDQTYLQRILINLSNNAIQAMPKGGKLTITATTNNGKARIIVQDTGEGIPENVKGKIFTPLITTKARGQGFGLASVKRFTEAMGGTVTFETEAGKGTKFILEFPI